MNYTVGINNFVRRQTLGSEFSHFEGSWNELTKLVTENLHKAVQGYKEGVLLAPVPAANFFTGVVAVGNSTELVTSFSARREGEAPYIHVFAKNGKKLPANFVNIVLYRSDVLEETNDRSTESDWEIISINASTEETEPMQPMAMARNMLNLAGGSSATYTAEEFAKAIIYWSDKVNIAPVTLKSTTEVHVCIEKSNKTADTAVTAWTTRDKAVDEMVRAAKVHQYDCDETDKAEGFCEIDKTNETIDFEIRTCKLNLALK